MRGSLLRALFVAVLLMAALCSYAQCEKEIKDFYVAYMLNIEDDDEANQKLMQDHMSAQLIARLADYSAQYDADAVIHAQDVSKHGIESLVVLPLSRENLYEVKYQWGAESEYTVIIVKAIFADGKLLIQDIYPMDAGYTTM